MSGTFRLLREHWEEMREHVKNLAPEEACGLVAGVEGQSVEVFPVENTLHSEVRYRMEPQGQLDAMLTIEEKGWDIAAIYHSHPYGPEGPSRTDIEEAAYPGVIHLIWNQKGMDWSCRGYSIERGTAREIEIALIQKSNSYCE